MVKYCVAYGCKEYQLKGNGIQFHRFPFSRPEILKKWIQAICREHWAPSGSSTLCSKHFTPDSYQVRPGAPTRLLKEDAVPSIFDFTDHLKKKIVTRKQLVGKEPVIKPDHFTPDQWENNRADNKRKLKPNAVPTLFSYAPEKNKSLKKRKKLLQTIPKDSGKRVTNEVNEGNATFLVHDLQEKQIEDGSLDDSPVEEFMDEYEPQVKPQFTHLCRLCASPSEDTVSLFENEQSNSELLEKIHTYLPIMITAEDLLPTAVCDKCIKRLEICHTLVQDCLDADAALKTIYGFQSSSQEHYSNKSVADARSDSYSALDTSNNILMNESTSRMDYNYTNLSDIKIEVEDDYYFQEENIPNQTANKEDNIENTDPVILDSTMVEKPAFVTETVNMKPNLKNNQTKKRRGRKLKLLIVEKKGGSDVTNKEALERTLQLAIKAILTPEDYLYQKTKERDKLSEMPIIDHSCNNVHKEVPRYKDSGQDSCHIHEKITKDHISGNKDSEQNYGHVHEEIRDDHTSRYTGSGEDFDHSHERLTDDSCNNVHKKGSRHKDSGQDIYEKITKDHISENKDSGQDYGHIQEEICRDHTYTKKL